MFKLTDHRERAGAHSGKLAACVFHAFATRPVRSLALLTTAALAAGLAKQALADPPGSPTANELYSGCTFNPADLPGFVSIPTAHLNGLAGDTVVGHYIVIYRMDTLNNGQVLDGGGATGPIVCVANTKAVSASAESVPVPNSADQPDAVSVDIRATQGASILQYEVNEGLRNGHVENRLCHSTDTGIDCVLVQEPGS